MSCMQQHFSCCFYAAGAAAALLLQHVGCNPPHYQCRGGAAPVAFVLHAVAATTAVVLQWLQQLSCGSCHAAALQLLLSRYRRSGCSAAAACGSSSLQPTPAPLPMQGLWGRCTSSLPATATATAAVVLQWLRQPPCWSGHAAASQLLQLCMAAHAQLLFCHSMSTAANCSPPQPRHQSRGYGGATSSAFLLQPLLQQPSCCNCCGTFPLQLLLQLQLFGCCRHTAGAAAAVVQLQPVGHSSL